MFKTISLLFFQITAAIMLTLLVAGCSGVQFAQLTYDFPASGLALPPAARIKVVPTDDSDMAKQFAVITATSLAAIPSIVLDNDTPQYWLVCGGMAEVTGASAIQANGSAKTVMTVRSNATGGYMELTRVPQTSSSYALLASFSLVRVNDLSPITVFNIVIYDSDMGAPTVKSFDLYGEQLTAALNAKLREVFDAAPRKVSVSTVLPDGGSPALRDAVCRGDVHSARILAAQLGVPIDPAAINGDTQQLTNVFFACLSEELTAVTIEPLERLNSYYLRILELSGNDSLTEATAKALARVEEKLRVLSRRG